MKTKDLLLLEAFKLYATNPYDNVTFTKLELVTGLSRGAILYHFKSKELLFNAVVERFILDESSASDLLTENCGSLSDFIKKFILKCKFEVEKYRSIGIYNINLAKLHIEFHAISYYKDMTEIAENWLVNEKRVWKIYISKAMENNEIREDLNIDIISTMFVSIYQGTSFAGISRSQGYDISMLEKQFKTVYDLIKKK